jgi:uncharacterized membrane protein
VIGKKHAEKGGQIVHIGTYLHWEELEADAKFQRLPLRG